MLKLHSRRQNNVGVFSRVGHKMFDHDREEIRAGQSPSNFGLMRNAGERIAPVDEEGFHRRVGRLEQSFTEPCHAQRSCARRSQIIAAQRRPVPAEETARVVTDASARMAPVAGDAWYASDRAHGHASPAVALYADTNADPGRTSVGQAFAERHDGLWA